MREKIFALLASVLLTLLLPALALAQSVAQSFAAEGDLQRGMIVAITSSDRNKVEAISSSRSKDVLGVVVSETDSAISITGEDKEVYVANEGIFEVLVSDLAGSISKGDYITLSSVEGVGVKASDAQPIIVGRALGEFSGNGSDVTEATVRDSKGKEKEIKIGRVEIDIAIGKNPLVSDAEAPLILQRIGETIAGRNVEGPRIYLGLGVLILAVGVAGSIIYGAVHSGIISIGRNPLSRGVIYQTMVQTILVGFIIFFAAVIGVYLMLRI